jgi:CBS domain-containing protein
MIATQEHLLDLTAEDLETKIVVSLPETMPLRDAAKELLGAGVHGAPVVDAAGRCVGVLSVTDLARWAVQRTGGTAGRPRTCSYQETHRGLRGAETVLCTVEKGRCPYQHERRLPNGTVVTACREPHTVCHEWQMVEIEGLPTEDVRHYMTAEPVTADPDTPIAALARLMINSVVQRVIVTDADRRPVGIVSATDLVAALARADEDLATGPEGD